MPVAKAYAAQSAETPLAPFGFERRELRPNDVAIDILYCGVCHSDLHTVRSEWPGTVYPCVPGHEIVGRVTAVGPEVSQHRAGDLVAVGCLVDSCRACSACREGLEQFCETGLTGTYNSPDRVTGENTKGGYSDSVVVREEFVLKVKHGEQDLAAVAPLLCAGITTWSPLRHWKAGPGSQVGVVGIGGLGHMGIKLAKALGADEVVVSRDPAQMQAQAGKLDLIVNTVAAPHNLDAFLALLKRDGTMVLVGVPSEPHPSPHPASLVMQRRSLAGSLIGGIPETQELLDFCAEHGIVSDVELIPIQEIETAYARMLKSDVKYRFVIDMASLKAA